MIDPIVIQHRLAHVGDIRTGTRSEKGYPQKLSTFRITSPHEAIAVEVAGLYGGTVLPWEDGYEVITTLATLPVIVPPQDFEPWLETWSKGGLQKRCTGTTEYSTGWPPKKVGPCPNTNESTRDCSFGCKPATRLSVLLPDTSIVGTFTIRSTGWNAYSEISSAMALLRGPHAQGVYTAATLELRQEERRHDGKVNKYGVVTLRPHITGSIRELMDTPQALHPSGRPILPQDQPPIHDDPTPILNAQVEVVQASGPSTTPPPPPPTPQSGISVPGGSGSNGWDATALPLTDDVPPPLPDDTGGEVTNAGSNRTVTPPPTSDHELAALDELTEWLTNPPNDADTMKLLEVKLRTAYQLASSSGVIPDDGDATPLVNRAVTKYANDHPQDYPDGALHVSTLRKADLRALTEKTFTYLESIT